MCEFDESNQPCITKYYNISHWFIMILPWLYTIYGQFVIEAKQQNPNLCEKCLQGSLNFTNTY